MQGLSKAAQGKVQDVLSCNLTTDSGHLCHQPELPAANPPPAPSSFYRQWCDIEVRLINASLLKGHTLSQLSQQPHDLC